MMESFQVVGISTRTNNKDEINGACKIAKIWERFFAEAIMTKIPEAVSSEIYAVYSNYESDFNGDYDFTLGLRSPTQKEIPGLNKVQIPEGNYVHLETEKGPSNKVVFELWQKVWKLSDKELGGTRAYKADYEVYGMSAVDPDNAVVDLLLGIK